MRDAGFKMIRYADDMVIMCRSREEAEAALKALQSALEERQLELHPEKTGLVTGIETFPLLLSGAV